MVHERTVESSPADCWFFSEYPAMTRRKMRITSWTKFLVENFPMTKTR